MWKWDTRNFPTRSLPKNCWFHKLQVYSVSLVHEMYLGPTNTFHADVKLIAIGTLRSLFFPKFCCFPSFMKKCMSFILCKSFPSNCKESIKYYSTYQYHLANMKSDKLSLGQLLNKIAVLMINTIQDWPRKWHSLSEIWMKRIPPNLFEVVTNNFAKEVKNTGILWDDLKRIIVVVLIK